MTSRNGQCLHTEHRRGQEGTKQDSFYYLFGFSLFQTCSSRTVKSVLNGKNAPSSGLTAGVLWRRLTSTADYLRWMFCCSSAALPGTAACRAFRWSVSEACIALLTFTMWEANRLQPHFSNSTDCFAEKKLLPILYQQIEDKAGLIALDELIPGLCQILASWEQFLDQQTGRENKNIRQFSQANWQDRGRAIVNWVPPVPLIFTPNFSLSRVLTQYCHPVIQVINEPLLQWMVR